MKEMVKERSAAIKQFVEEFSNERKKEIKDFIAEEERIRGVLSDLKDTFSSGNDLLLTTNSLLEKFNTGSLSDTTSEPFDIKVHHEMVTEVSRTARELTILVDSTNQLLTNVGLEKLLPQIVKTVDKVEDEGEKIVNHSFRKAVFLIIIWMAAYILAKVIVSVVAKRRA
jgi:hypothetical protein